MKREGDVDVEGKDGVITRFARGISKRFERSPDRRHNPRLTLGYTGIISPLVKSVEPR